MGSTKTTRPVTAVVDGALSPDELRDLLAYTISREADFVDTRVLASAPDALPVVDPDVRRNLHLRGTANVPAAVMERLRHRVPYLASTLDDEEDQDLAGGIYEADITATADGGFFRPHIDNGNASVRNRSTSFVLFFSHEPRSFRGGALCIERDWRVGDRLFMFDALQEGRLTRKELAEVIEPITNRLVVFRSRRLHEVRPVLTENAAFASARFTVTGFVRVGPSPPSGNETADYHPSTDER
jgi:predicted 2-oxoglutarate/Fe(II)-dependent dioxygenase YbiX